ncbi:centrosomal protein of 131 kDa [Zophobas morio]|uniref:centrosomal protein of 131 kDa n=1 Tax=Zophobas morio TaxID=2755281 RepID=UPI0030836CCB
MSGKQLKRDDNGVLRLDGGKICLEARPPSKASTASSKSSMLTRFYSRPVSAVPLLALNKDDGDGDFKSKRPFSAEYLPSSYLNRLNSRVSTREQSIDSLESVQDESLSSAALLKNLLSEPIKSWRNYSGSKSEETKEERLLTPGVVSKPPLPKKPDSSKTEDPGVSAIHDYLTLKYDKEREKSADNKIEKAPSDDSAINLITLDDVSQNDKDERDDVQKLHIQNWIDEKNEDTEAEWEDPKQIPNLSDLDIDDLFKDDSEKKFDNFFRNVEDKSPKKKTKASPKPKVKFTATPIRADPDYAESCENNEVETWLSKKPEKKTNFLDFLNNIDELEKSMSLTGVDISHDVPQHDTETTPNSPTYDDIAAILKVLEDEDKKSQLKMETMKQLVDSEISGQPLPLTVEDHKNEDTKFSDSQKTILESDQTIKNVKPNIVVSEHDNNTKTHTSIHSSSNYKELLSFLDEVDRSCSKPLTEVKVEERPKIKLDTIPRLEDLLTFTPEELAHQIVSLSLKLKEKSSSIALLQSEVSSLRAQIVTSTKKTDQTLKHTLRTQKEDYEATIKRHQKFIDQLINDKKSLNQQCEGLVSEMKSLEERHQSNLKAIEHKNHVEMQKVKEMAAAGEKLRRERWIDSKTQKIKELTVKSIEPELHNLEKRQQQELTDLRMLHRKEIEDLELKNARRTQEQCEALRVQLVEEREKALAHEREVMRVRYEKMVEAEEKGLQEQRRRLLGDHAARIAECEQREVLANNEKERGIKQAQEDFEERLQMVIRRHANEIKLVKETASLEMETWQNNYKKQQTVLLAEKEALIREQCRRERDKEIESVIERLESEASETKTQLEQSTENRIKRLREKYDKEIADLEESEKEAKNKYLEVKKKLVDEEDVIISLRATIEHLKGQLEVSKAATVKLQDEREAMREILKNELKREMEGLEMELTTVKNSRENEIQQLYSRVKVAIARKDEVLEELTRDHKALQEKCSYLENMLEQQRKEYLIK